MMLIDASWPSNRLAAVTKRTLLTGLKTCGLCVAERSFMANLVAGRRAAHASLELVRPERTSRGAGGPAESRLRGGIGGRPRLLAVYVNVN